MLITISFESDFQGKLQPEANIQHLFKPKECVGFGAPPSVKTI